MNIALFGYGKMGKMIERTAQKRGHTIVSKIDTDTTNIDYTAMDVAIDFSTPEAALLNIKGCLSAGVPIISGTTGWLAHFEEAVNHCQTHNGAFLYASNYSIGVNIFFELNQHLAKMMAQLKEYQVSIEETHHTQKLDAPSGTAISLAEGIIAETTYSKWSKGSGNGNTIPIQSFREGEVPGTHTVSYEGPVDTIRIQHMAHNREGFALGAVLAAEWILGKQGVFNMKDVLNLR